MTGSNPEIDIFELTRRLKAEETSTAEREQLLVLLAEDRVDGVGSRAIKSNVWRLLHAHSHRDSLPSESSISIETPQVASESATPAARPSKWHRRRPYVALAATILLLCSVAVGAISILAGKALLEDDFQDNSIDLSKWNGGELPGLEEKDGFMWLTDRAFLATTKEFDGPLELTLRWQWINLAKHPNFSDSLAIVIHTSGKQKKERAYTATDGLVVELNASSNQAAIYWINSEGPFTNLTHTDVSHVPIPANKWHHIRIRDTGRRIELFVTGPELKASSEPILTANYSSGRAPGKRIAIYNREALGDFHHLSMIDDVVIQRLDDGEDH